MTRATDGTFNPLGLPLQNRQDFFWVYIPVLFLVMWTGIEFTMPEPFILHAVSENGFIEWVHVGCSFMTSMIAFYFFIRTDIRRYPLFKFWFLCFALGNFYISGEEISWGQWIFHWNTPELFDALNDQHETNLHNMSSWLDQKPRILVELGVVMSGLILPQMDQRKWFVLPSWLKSLLPPRQAIILAFSYLLVKGADIYGNITQFRLQTRASEIIELIIYYYMFVYILALGLKTRA